MIPWLTEITGLLGENARLYALDETDSTNVLAKQRLLAGEAPGFAVIAARQTAGRGRMGRSFWSPEGGIYFTVTLPYSESLCVTARAAVAVCRAIQGETGLSPRIKWVNDLYLNGLKVCGILAESVQMPSGARAVALGVGVNYTLSDVPEALRGVAGALFTGEPTVRRAVLAARLIRETRDTHSPFIDTYRALSQTLGRDVRFSKNGGWAEGRAEEIDDSGALIVRLTGGERVTLRTGEITLREQPAPSACP